MGIETGIQWCDATWNPWYGCRKVSEGCKNCYMYREMRRYGKDPVTVKRASKASFLLPLKWMHSGKLNPGARIFVCSWSDFFIEDADEWRDEAWTLMAAMWNYTFIIPTKRPERIQFCHPPWIHGNVWILVSIENQSQMERYSILNRSWEFKKGISFEPLLGLVLLPDQFKPDWVITGGESGPGCRPADLDWFRSIRNQGLDRRIPYFHKQNGGTKKIGGAWGGRLLDGVEWNQFPGVYDEQGGGGLAYKKNNQI